MITFGDDPGDMNSFSRNDADEQFDAVLETVLTGEDGGGFGDVADVMSALWGLVTLPPPDPSPLLQQLLEGNGGTELDSELRARRARRVRRTATALVVGPVLALSSVGAAAAANRLPERMQNAVADLFATLTPFPGHHTDPLPGPVRPGLPAGSGLTTGSDNEPAATRTTRQPTAGTSGRPASPTGTTVVGTRPRQSGDAGTTSAHGDDGTIDTRSDGTSTTSTGDLPDSPEPSPSPAGQPGDGSDGGPATDPGPTTAPTENSASGSSGSQDIPTPDAATNDSSDTPEVHQNG